MNCDRCKQEPGVYAMARVQIPEDTSMNATLGLGRGPVEFYAEIVHVCHSCHKILTRKEPAPEPVPDGPQVDITQRIDQVVHEPKEPKETDETG